MKTYQKINTTVDIAKQMQIATGEWTSFFSMGSKGPNDEFIASYSVIDDVTTITYDTNLPVATFAEAMSIRAANNAMHQDDFAHTPKNYANIDAFLAWYANEQADSDTYYVMRNKNLSARELDVLNDIYRLALHAIGSDAGYLHKVTQREDRKRLVSILRGMFESLREDAQEHLT